MKKISPLILAVTLFSAFMALQIGFDLTARQTDKSKQEYTHYEKVFEKLSLTDTKQNKYELAKAEAPIVILNFWASWCRPCLEEFPSLNELRAKFGSDKILILGINSDEAGRDGEVEKAIKVHKISFPTVRDPVGDILSEYLISAIPVSIVYHKGKVIDVGNGAKDFMAEEFLELLRSKGI